MLHELRRLESRLPWMLEETSEWDTLDITYHPPHVERLWRPVEGGRVYLHLIHPCDEGDALCHPHPWPSVVKILKGRYEHGLGLLAAEDDAGPVVETLSTAILTANSYYEMTNPRAWHWVRPFQATYTLMFAGEPWAKEVQEPFRKPEQPQKPLTDERKARLLAQFQMLCLLQP